MVSFTEQKHQNETFNRKAFTDRLRALRKDRFVTQEAFANSLGISERQYQKYESAKETAIPNLETFTLMFQTLLTSPGYLLLGIGPRYVGPRTAEQLRILMERFTDPTNPHFTVIVGMLMEIEDKDTEILLHLTEALLKARTSPLTPAN